MRLVGSLWLIMLIHPRFHSECSRVLWFGGPIEKYANSPPSQLEITIKMVTRAHTMRVRISRASAERNCFCNRTHILITQWSREESLSGASSTNANTNIFTQLQSIKQTKEEKWIIESPHFWQLSTPTRIWLLATLFSSAAAPKCRAFREYKTKSRAHLPNNEVARPEIIMFQE